MNADTRPLSDEQVAAASYIADLTSSLGRLAHDHQLTVLGYLLDMARTEAEHMWRAAAVHARPGSDTPQPPEPSQ
jgi:hypothetical protein